MSVKGDVLIDQFDAVVWAKEFIKQFADLKVDDDIVDEELMIAWFASAIMTGHDHGYRKKQSALQSKLDKAVECLRRIEKMGCNPYGGDEPCWACEAKKCIKEIETKKP